MKTRKHKAYCIIEITDDPKELPSMFKTKSEAVNHSRSYHGHPCDDPRKRGALAECEITIKMPAMPPVTAQLADYVYNHCGRPAILAVDDEEWNASTRKRAKAEQLQMLRRLERAYKKQS